MTVQLVIIDSSGKPTASDYANLRDARAALIGHQNRRGLHLTTKPSFSAYGLTIQYGDLMSGMEIVGGWNISYPVEERQSA